MGDKLMEKFYFGFLLLLPLVFCSTIIDSVLLPRQILLTVFLLIVIFLLILQKKALHFNFKTPIIYALTGFLLVNYISFFQAAIPGESHAVFSKLLVLISFFFVTTIVLYNSLIRLNQLILALVIFGLLTLSFPLFELIQKTLNGGHLLKDVNLIKGNAANKNLLSSVLFLTLPFYFIGLQLDKKIKVLSILGIVSTLFVLATIRTRAALLAVFIFFALLLCYKIKRRFAIKKRYFLVSGIGLLFLLLFFYNSYFERKITNLNSSSTEVGKHYIARLLDSKTLQSRVHFWENSIQMAKEHPMLGVGIGNWQIQFPKYGLNNFSEYAIVNGESTLQRPHNDFIWILCETGIFGLLAYLLIFGVIFYQLYSLIRKATSPKEKWKFFFILSTLVGYLVISFFDFPYERIEHQVLLMLLFAIVVSAYCKAGPITTKNQKSLIWVLLLPISYSFLVSFFRLSGEQHATKMYTAKNNKNWSETIYESQKAANYFYLIDNTSMPLTWYEGIAHFNENRIAESETCFEKAYQLTPYNIQVITNLASTYQLTGKVEKATELYHDALKISNNFDEAKLNLAALYFNQREFDKAYATIYEVKVSSKNPKYKTYLVPILNQKINSYLKTATNKTVVNNLIQNITTKEALMQLFFDAKKNNVDFERYLVKAKF